MPQGPDSGFQFYDFQGKRRDYFDTSPVAHALDEPAYIVEPHPPGTKLVPTGLPVFTLYYANDDDGERKLGSDSRLLFTAPADGSYLVRVTDAIFHLPSPISHPPPSHSSLSHPMGEGRGEGQREGEGRGEGRFAYRLTVRKAKPDF